MLVTAVHDFKCGREVKDVCLEPLNTRIGAGVKLIIDRARICDCPVHSLLWLLLRPHRLDFAFVSLA